MRPLFFVSSVGREGKWTTKNVGEMRLNALVGFPLGGALSLAIMAAMVSPARRPRAGGRGRVMTRVGGLDLLLSWGMFVLLLAVLAWFLLRRPTDPIDPRAAATARSGARLLG